MNRRRQTREDELQAVRHPIATHLSLRQFNLMQNGIQLFNGDAMLCNLGDDLEHRRLECVNRIAGYPFNTTEETHFTMTFLKTR